jgi:hypothetical protein
LWSPPFKAKHMVSHLLLPPLSLSLSSSVFIRMRFTVQCMSMLFSTSSSPFACLAFVRGCTSLHISQPLLIAHSFHTISCKRAVRSFAHLVSLILSCYTFCTCISYIRCFRLAHVQFTNLFFVLFRSADSNCDFKIQLVAT